MNVSEPPGWLDQDLREEQRLVYQEASKAAFYFSDWRNNLLKYFAAFAAALAVAAQWLQQNSVGPKPLVSSELVVATPFIIGYALAVLLCWMDYRNMLLLRVAHGVTSSLEAGWAAT